MTGGFPSQRACRAESVSAVLNRLFRRRSKKKSKLRVTGLCVGNSPGPVNSPHKGPVARKMFHLVSWCHHDGSVNVSCITMTSHERHAFSDHRSFDYLLISLLGATLKKHHSLRCWPLWGEFTVDRWIPRTNGHYRGKAFMSWRHHIKDLVSHMMIPLPGIITSILCLPLKSLFGCSHVLKSSCEILMYVCFYHINTVRSLWKLTRAFQ